MDVISCSLIHLFYSVKFINIYCHFWKKSWHFKLWFFVIILLFMNTNSVSGSRSVYLNIKNGYYELADEKPNIVKKSNRNEYCGPEKCNGGGNRQQTNAISTDSKCGPPAGGRGNCGGSSSSSSSSCGNNVSSKCGSGGGFGGMSGGKGKDVNAPQTCPNSRESEEIGRILKTEWPNRQHKCSTKKICWPKDGGGGGGGCGAPSNCGSGGRAGAGLNAIGFFDGNARTKYELTDEDQQDFDFKPSGVYMYNYEPNNAMSTKPVPVKAWTYSYRISEIDGDYDEANEGAETFDYDKQAMFDEDADLTVENKIECTGIGVIPSKENNKCFFVCYRSKRSGSNEINALEVCCPDNESFNKKTYQCIPNRRTKYRNKKRGNQPNIIKYREKNMCFDKPSI